jgi:hypothetical protein
LGTPRNMTKPNSRVYRQSTTAARAAFVELPAEGCTLPVPELPRSREWNEVERARWEELWESPQATQWDDSCRGTVALLVAYESRLLSGDDGGSAWVAQECRYASEALGLTPKAMASLGWRIADAKQ